MKKILAALLFGALAAAPAAAAEEPSSAPLFAATLPDADGKPVALAALRGKPLIVNFWARWCSPCRTEIPELVAAHERFGPRGLTVVGIALDDNGPNTRDFIKAYGMAYGNLLAPDQGIGLMQALGNEKAGLPFTLVIDRNGAIIGKKLGPMKQQDIETYAARLLGSP